MTLRSLYLQHFRNYEEAYLEFSPQFNLICGPNAKGKTTLLEAIHCLMIGRSFRTSHYPDLIQQQFESFFLEAQFYKHGIEQTLKFGFHTTDRKIIYNSTPLATLSNLLGLIPGVIITPDDVQLVKGSPQLRRQFLDIQIAQVDPLYVHHLNRYGRALKQRNHLLKMKQQISIDSWEQEMTHSAAYLIQQRYQTITHLQNLAQKYYHLLSGENDLLTLEYRSIANSNLSIDEIKKLLVKQLCKNRQREMQIGYTLSGPHKDDLFVAIGGRDIRYFASEGQQRSCVNALHFAEWSRLHQRGDGDFPLFMIDDIGMSLDSNRKDRLVEQLQSVGQVFLTTTDPKFLDYIDVDKKIFTLPFYN
ncbi:DNA replication/repair protein RecF [Candidatus Protochlamydia sp. W-9]|uniref:DNA replication/repair protein RecF n=1 Tax=Candidatus Protochlamydia sp. W-9 TaxID=1785087 RepID=UPI00096AC830|nr:DNA replication/repair protein RecF [Candidatus Protochlamydia sp. W-9]